MKFKRFAAFLLSISVLLSLFSPAAFAAVPSSFRDIEDEATAVSADVLRLMGVVSGTGDNQFRPQETLTRAQFCSMAVYFMGLGDQVVLHTTRTIFQDVRAGHWALGQINLAASTTLGDSEERLISGVGDGNFAPDAPITFAQAVTILLRILNYTDASVGAAWPYGYLNLAASLGLTEGIVQAAGAPVTRAQAARLFVRALSTDTRGGTPYYNQRAANVQTDTVLLAVNVAADDGTPGAIRTSRGAFLPERRGINAAALQGHRGVLLLNAKNEVLTFLPDESTTVSGPLSSAAQSAWLTVGGTRYNISADTPVYAPSQPDSTYDKAWPSLKAGTQVTVFLDRGKVVGLYYNSGSVSVTDGAVVVSGQANASSFATLTGGIAGFRVQKNRMEIALGDLQPLDVATFDALSNTLTVSDLRLSGIYESAAPNTATPTHITALGREFQVLESAWAASDKCAMGDRITLLLTADGKVAAIRKTETGMGGNAVGIAEGNKVLLTLPNGQTLEFQNSADLPSGYQGQLVSFYSVEKGRLSTTRFTGSSASGAFNVAGLTLGSRKVSPGVTLYETLEEGMLAELTLSDLDLDTVAAGDIASYRTDSSGTVTHLVLRGVTGNAYTYGRLHVDVNEIRKTDEDGNETDEIERIIRTLELQNSGKYGTIPSQQLPPVGYKDGDFGGVALSPFGRILSVVTLTPVTGVKASDFFVRDGRTYVTAGGRTYLVSDQVECYNSDSKTFFAGDDPLTQIRAFSAQLTIYVDSVGSRVRVVATA